MPNDTPGMISVSRNVIAPRLSRGTRMATTTRIPDTWTLMSRNNQWAGVKKDFHNETSALVRMSYATLNMFTSEQ